VKTYGTVSLLLALAGTLGAGGAVMAQDITLNVANWGGRTSAATEAAYYTPYTAATGVKAVNVDAASEMAARVEAQYSANRVDWDMLQSADRTLIEVLARKGYIAKMPADMKERLAAKLPAHAINDYGIATGTNAHLIVCNMDVVKVCPQSLAEFFDVEAFPYNRSIRGTAPIYVVSYAAVANGVPRAEVGSTPVDMDAAFATLERVKPHVTAAYQLAAAGNYELVWNDAARSAGSTVVLEKAPNKAEAFRFMEWIVNNPKHVAEWISATGNSVSVPEAFEFIDADLLARIADNPAYQDGLFDINVSWYADNQQDLEDRWREFLGT
jgi:spermidine/putrescine-binding protein